MILFATILWWCMNIGSAQSVECYKNAGCHSQDLIDGTLPIFDCCIMPNSYSYSSRGSCNPCYTYGWVMEISTDYTQAVAQSDVIAGEGQNVTLTLFFLKNNPSISVDLFLDISVSGSATEEEDYILSYPDPLYLVRDPINVNVTLLNDIKMEGSEDIILTLVLNTSVSHTNESIILTNPTIKITIKDDPVIALESYSIYEGYKNSYNICINIKGYLDEFCDSFPLNVMTINGTAKAGEDFYEIDETITIYPCEKNCFGILIIDDDNLELDEEQFTIVLQDSDGDKVAENSYDITDDDEAGVGFEFTTYFVAESNRYLDICIKLYYGRNMPVIAAFPIDLFVSTTDRSAVAGRDFIGLTNTLVSIPPGETQTCFSVTILRNCVRDQNDLKKFELFIGEYTLVSRVKVDQGEAEITITESDNDCPMLTNPAFGSVVLNGSPNGVLTANFSCSPGFKLVGVSLLTCDGISWNHQIPHCMPVCPRLTDPEGGSVSLIGSPVVERAIYSCSYGYELIGDNILTCGNNRKWITKPPICWAVCSKLNDPTNGTVITINGTEHIYAIYSCNAGYGLVGNPLLTCLSDGSWNQEPPRCKLVCEKCPIVKCDSCCQPTTCPPPTPCPTCPSITTPTTDAPPTLISPDTMTLPPNTTTTTSEPPEVSSEPPVVSSETPTTAATEPPPPTPPPRPGDIQNVTLVQCGRLWWNPQPGNVTYKVRLFTGRNYGTTPPGQKKVFHTSTNSLNFTATDIPTGRPMFAVIKARNSEGTHSRNWSMHTIAADIDCP